MIWFYKNSESFLRELEIYEKLESHDKGDINLSDYEVNQLEKEAEKLNDENSYIDLKLDNIEKLFKTDNVFYTIEECINWINDPNNSADIPKYFYKGRDLSDDENYQYVVSKLRDFWTKFPNGVIECSL